MSYFIFLLEKSSIRINYHGLTVKTIADIDLVPRNSDHMYIKESYSVIRKHTSTSENLDVRNFACGAYERRCGSPPIIGFVFQSHVSFFILSDSKCSRTIFLYCNL